MSNIRTLKDLENQSQPYQPFGVSQSNERDSSSGGGAQSCLQAVFPGFKYRSFTFIVTIIQVAIFILSELYFWYLGYYVDKNASYTCVLYKLGSKYTPAIVFKYHLHRLVFPIFLHGSLGHIFFNMLSQTFYGYFLEQKYGIKRFAFLYIVSGIGGNLLSAAFVPTGTAIGASSSLFGLIAFQCVYFFENWDRLGPGKNRAILWMAIILISNISSARGDDTIDHHGHAGGFILGALIALQYIEYDADPKFYVKQKIALGIAVSYVVGLLAYIFSLRYLAAYENLYAGKNCSYVGW